MASEIKTWHIINGKLELAHNTLQKEGLKEKDHLEQWIKSNPSILGNDIAIIGEQIQTASGPLDFLGVDNTGNIVIVELKRDRLPREALLQAIDYASDISDWDLEKFREICKGYTNQSFEDFFQQRFEGVSLEDLSINQVQRLLLVGFSVEDSLNRMIEWLSDKYNVGINAVILNYVKTPNGDEILSRTVIIPEEIEKQKVNKRKFIVEMSDDPGNYDLDVLESKFTEYLTNNQYSSKRIKELLLPILLEKKKVNRDQIKKEFVKAKEATDEGQAGIFLALISNQLGQKNKDYLRQIISYEYPNHTWEKDNFQIREEYIELVKKTLSILSSKNE